MAIAGFSRDARENTPGCTNSLQVCLCHFGMVPLAKESRATNLQSRGGVTDSPLGGGFARSHNTGVD